MKLCSYEFKSDFCSVKSWLSSQEQPEDNYISSCRWLMIMLMIFMAITMIKTGSLQALTCPHLLHRFQVELTFLCNWCPNLMWADCVIGQMWRSIIHYSVLKPSFKSDNFLLVWTNLCTETKKKKLFSFPVVPQKGNWHIGVLKHLSLSSYTPGACWNIQLVCVPTQKSYIKSPSMHKSMFSVWTKDDKMTQTGHEIFCSKYLVKLDETFSIALPRFPAHSLFHFFSSGILGHCVRSHFPVLYLPLSLTFTQLISLHGSSRGKYHRL